MTTLPQSRPLTRVDLDAMRSPSARHLDLMLQRSRFETAGGPAYWVVGPDGSGRSPGSFVTARTSRWRHVPGDEEYAARQPYPVVVRPHDPLIDCPATRTREEPSRSC